MLFFWELTSFKKQSHDDTVTSRHLLQHKWRPNGPSKSYLQQAKVSKDIAESISSGTCLSVSDGSHKAPFGTAAWILTDAAMAKLSGTTTAPGWENEQGSFCSKLEGIYSMVHIVNHVYREAFFLDVMDWMPFSNISINAGISLPQPPLQSYLGIRNALKWSPIIWHWTHICGYQDDVKHTAELSQLKVLNTQMAQMPNSGGISYHSHNTSKCPLLLGEGWTIWLNWCRLATFSQEIFDTHTQYLCSQKYWEQSNKLSFLYHSIDWKICGMACKKFPLAQQLWSTKWLTNWLPVGKNMLRWKMDIEDMGHIITCPDISQCKHFSTQIAKLEPTLISKKFPPLVVTTILELLFSTQYQLTVITLMPPLLLCLQQSISKSK